ncbi:MAG: adenylosuccinate lyase, partial [Deltaproteobacteria bacterium]|nr:adenylosuccinate lyase [Deltaproteobacteria bacterium]
MIDRYTRPRMGKLWNTETKYKKWLQVELAHCEVLAEEGLIPKEALAIIQKKASFDVSEIEAIEKKVKHDVIAFLTNVSEKIGTEGRYLHFGLTSSDVLDTTFALLLKESAQNILDELK